MPRQDLSGCEKKFGFYSEHMEGYWRGLSEEATWSDLNILKTLRAGSIVQGLPDSVRDERDSVSVEG